MYKGSLGSPSAAIMSRLIYAGGNVDYQGPRLGDDGEEDEGEMQELEGGPTEMQGNVKVEGEVKRRESMYVTLFEDMLKTVLGGEEEALFSRKEIDCFYYFSRLSYNARYLIIRLLLRRPDKWHRLDSLKYQAELGNRANIIDAIKELCKLDEEVEIKAEEQEVVDLTLDDNDTYSPPSLPQVQAQAGPSISCQVKDESAEPDLTVLAEDESKMDLRCLLECLTVDELKSFAKDMKVKTVQKRVDIISALLNVTPAQTTLDYTKRRLSSKIGSDGAVMRSLRQTTLSFFPGQKCKTQQDRLREMVLAKLGKCIRVNSAFQKLVNRAHLVCFRLTQHAQTLLTPSILCQAKKRCYPAYAWSRTPDIWPNREALIAYEEALELEAQVDAIFDGSVPVSFVRCRSAASKTPARVTEHRFRTPSTPGSVLRPSTSGSSESPDQKSKGKARLVEGADEDVKTEAKDDSPRVQEGRAVKAIFEEIYPKWQAQVITKGEEDGRRFGLERFDCGHVLTRIVCKGAYALGILKDHRYELQVLEELLGQKRWRRGRRGKWHDRRALILMTHFPKDEATTSRALDVVVEALEDPDTHIICRPMLERRLCRLEKRLGLSSGERHTSEGKLKEAAHVVIQGIRIRNRAAGLTLDQMGRSVKTMPATPSKDQNIARFLSSPVCPDKSPVKISLKEKEENEKWPKGKSTWNGRNGEAVDVEIFALQYYEDMGFKGVHCETRVIHMLFGLLFWDIIFSPVPGAFETPFQSAPLDIAEDSFYHSRKDIIEQRLEELVSGKAQEIIERIDNEYRPNETCCVGVKWDLFTKQDLVEIVTCLGGTALSVICRLLCEDYAGRGSGGPDLFIWDAQKTLCKFVEVKGPGDSLQENQKVWIDVLLRASVAVEVCRVKEEGEVSEKSRNKVKKRKPRTKTKKEGHNDSEPEEKIVESEDEPDELPSALPSLPSSSQTVVACSTPSRAKRGHTENTPPTISAISPEIVRSTDSRMDWTPSQGRGKRRRTSAINLAEVVTHTPSKKPRFQISS